MEIVRITSKDEIIKAFYEISEVFPNLNKRVNVEDYIEKLATYADVFVMVDDNCVGGFLAMYANDDIGKTAYLTLIGVKEEHRGKHYGSKLFNQFVVHAKEKGMTKLRLEVDCDNVIAIKLYEKNGFIVEQMTQHNSVYMYKKL